jgi:ATP-dependent Clp protease ATP-binding subunit ClpB
VFRPLAQEQLQRIVELQLDRLRNARRARHHARAHRSRALIAEDGYDPAFGARPLKRAIQRLVQNPLALLLLEGEFQDGDTVVVAAAEQTSSAPRHLPCTPRVTLEE